MYATSLFIAARNRDSRPRSSFSVIWKSRRAHSARFLRVCRRTGAKFTLCGHAIFHCCQAVCHMFCHPSRAADTSHRTHIAAAGEKIKPAVCEYICAGRTPSHCAAEHRAAAAAVTVVIKRSPVHAAKWCVGNVERYRCTSPHLRDLLYAYLRRVILGERWVS
jgi:hypothetical protein